MSCNLTAIRKKPAEQLEVGYCHFPTSLAFGLFVQEDRKKGFDWPCLGKNPSPPPKKMELNVQAD